MARNEVIKELKELQTQCRNKMIDLDEVDDELETIIKDLSGYIKRPSGDLIFKEIASARADENGNRVKDYVSSRYIERIAHTISEGLGGKE